jgi:alpha-glucosidase
LKQLVTFYGSDLTGLQLPFNFKLIELPWSARRIGAAIARYEGLLPTGAWPNWVLGNHDRSRIASRVGDAQARVAAMLLLTLRGTPTLYYGDELGMLDVPVATGAQRDPQGLRGGDSRDPERTPMRWDRSANAGFSTVAPWLPMGDNLETVNVASELADSRSMLELHRRLLALRRQEPALTVGDWSALRATGDVLAYQRRANGRAFIVVLNMGTRPAEAEEPEGRVVLSTHLDREGEPVAGAVRVRPNEGLVVEAGGAASNP